MMDHEHDGGSNSSENQLLNPSGDQPESHRRAPARAAKFKQAFSRESLRAFGQRIHWPWIRSSSMGWLVLVGAVALFIQAIGLYNMLAVADEKQDWDASASQRQTLENDLASLLERKSAAQQALIAAKASLDHEQDRLTQLRAAIKIDQTLRDEAQRAHATADAEAKRLQQENATLDQRLKAYSLRLDATERQVTQLESKRDELAKKVAASNTILEEHRAEVAKATKHCQDLDKQAFDTLAAIRTTRESLVKAQDDLDAAVRQTAKAEAQRDAALTRLKNAELLESDATEKVDELKKQSAALTESLVQQQAKLQALTQDRAKAGAAMESAQTDLAAASKKLAESQGSLAALKTHIDEATKTQQSLKAEQASLVAAIKPLREQQHSLAADIAAKQQQLKALLERIDAAKQQAATAPQSSDANQGANEKASND